MPPTDLDEAARAVDDGMADIAGQFSGDIIRRGAALLKADTAMYGTAHGKAVTRIIAQNYINNMAGVAYPDKPVTPRIHAAAELMALALNMLYTDQTTETLAVAIKEIGVLSSAMKADARRGPAASVNDSLTKVLARAEEAAPPQR